MQPVRSLTVLYDPSCGLCSSAKAWLLKQPAEVRLEFVATESSEARTTYRDLPAGELAVIADTGEVWLGNRAWIVCLWALREYRSLACRLTTPGLLRLARQAFSAVSRNRLAVSRLLDIPSERDLERCLIKEGVPQCQTGRK
jgi:predicted DCC family thiol-disulfide oxidoreductase YuxK